MLDFFTGFRVYFSFKLFNPTDLFSSFQNNLWKSPLFFSSAERVNILFVYELRKFQFASFLEVVVTLYPYGFPHTVTN